jgi:hypothetical protein
MAYNKIGRTDQVITILGAWQHLVAREARHRGTPDPRIYVAPDGAVTQVIADRAPSALQQKLDRGEPVVVPGWRLPGGRALRRQHPELCGRSAVRVFPKDRVEPTEDKIDSTMAPPA